MKTDKDPNQAKHDDNGQGMEENQDSNLEWLLEMDHEDQEETLFQVSNNEYHDEGLSAFEAEVANRPLVRGNAGGDDLANYVAEEIVISSDGAAGDIFSSEQDDDNQVEAREEIMAIDFTVDRDDDQGGASNVDEGADILGLSSDDDIGEADLSIKRVKTTAKKTTAKKTRKTPAKKKAAKKKVEPKAQEKPQQKVEEKLAGAKNLTEAPVPSQVADPQEEMVANEDLDLGMDLGADLGADLQSAGDADLLSGFDGLDDISFDDLDVAAEGLGDIDAEFGDLQIEAGASDLGVADDLDFDDLDSLGVDAVSDIALVITPVMEEISQRAQVRAEALGLGASAVTVDVMLGSDETTANNCLADGYEPVAAICDELPEPLMNLGEAERGAIYVRLLSSASGENWNGLFKDDFDAGTSAQPEAQAQDEIEDIFGGSLEDDFAMDFDGEFSGDIDDAFSSLSSSEGTLDELTGAEFGELAQTQDEQPAAKEPLLAEVAQQESLVTESEPEPILSDADDTGMSWCIPGNIKFSYTTQSNAEIFAEFLDAFIEEGSSEVEKLEALVGEWEKAPESDTLLADVNRTLHTLKGIAKGVGLQRFGTLVHNYETLLEGLEGRDSSQENYFRIVNAWLDAVVRGLDFVTDHRADIASELPMVGAPEPEAPVAEASVESADLEEPDSIEVVPDFKGDADPIMSALERKRDQQLADEGAKALAAQQSVRITSEKLDHMLNLSNQAQQLGVRASQNTTRSKRSTSELMGRLSSVRAHIGKIADRSLFNVNARGGSHTDMDALEMDQYSELQEAANILREGVEDLADLVDLVTRQNVQIEALLKQQSSVVSSITTSLQAARVVPVSRMMPALRRIVRTVSTDLNKTVSFKVLNEIGALDRDHYAKLQVVMEHMVRNALDHGIESPDERLAAGKPTGGRITVDVQKSGEDYIIKLSDDGKGIDPDAIRESAYKKGLDLDVDALSDEEAQRLVFHKGFSTANQLSEISGRGVGMDIVLTELQQMGGDIQIQSVVGLGTTFELRIPSNVSVNGALMVAAAEESYAIPFNGLVAVEQVSVKDFYDAVESKHTLKLAEVDCEPAYLATLCKGVGLPDANVWEGSIPVIIAGTSGRHMAIAIDNVQEALELVVRSLGSQFANVPGLAGAATTADGEAIVALDLNLLVASAGEEGFTSIEVEEEEETGLLALVVDDSRTQRMVATSQLDTVGVETITAENGLVAIDLLNSAHRLPDVVLLDVEMPVKDGIETLKEIRKSQRYGDLPVIMVTSRTGAKHRALAKEAGCNAYMGKPFNFPALVEQINSLTGAELELSS